MKNIRFILGLLFLLIPWATDLNAQRYNNSIGIHYGLFQYNTAQNIQLLDVENGFLNAGLSYKHRLGRYSSLGFTGRLYDWELNDLQTLQTRSLESKWLIHAGRISNSWRVNLITPYIGAGIGYEMHKLTENNTNYTYNNPYIPIEAGFFFNLGPRLSLGVFAEYKLSAESDLKTRLGLENSFPALINSAGVTLTWQFGQKRTDLGVPVVVTNPLFIQYDERKMMKETMDTTAKLFPDTLEGVTDSIQVADMEKMAKPDSLTIGSKQQVFLPEVVKAVMDTIRIPIILDFSVKGLKQDEARPIIINGHALDSLMPADAKIDSLLRLTRNLMQRIDFLEGTPNDQLMPGVTGRTMPSITGQPQQVQQPQQFQQPQLIQQPQQPQQFQQPPHQIQQPAQTPIIITPAPATSPDREAFATKNDIEALRAEIRNLSAENREAIRVLNQNIRVAGFSTYQTTADPRTDEPDTLKQTYPDSEILGDDLNILPDTIKEWVAEEEFDKPEVSDEKHQLWIDSLQTVKKNLAEELKLQKEQNLKLKEEMSALVLLKEEQERQAKEDVALQYTVYFDVNSAEIISQHINKLSRVATKMLDNPDLKVQLSGYADGTGDPEYNALLSQWRVQAVRKELIKAGIPQFRILEQYFGSKTATGGLNPNERKVEIKVF